MELKQLSFQNIIPAIILRVLRHHDETLADPTVGQSVGPSPGPGLQNMNHTTKTFDYKSYLHTTLYTNRHILSSETKENMPDFMLLSYFYVGLTNLVKNIGCQTNNNDLEFWAEARMACYTS